MARCTLCDYCTTTGVGMSTPDEPQEGNFVIYDGPDGICINCLRAIDSYLSGMKRHPPQEDDTILEDDTADEAQLQDTESPFTLL